MAEPGSFRLVACGGGLGCVHWHNTERLHGYLGDVPPAEFEATHYAALATTNEAA